MKSLSPLIPAPGKAGDCKELEVAFSYLTIMGQSAFPNMKMLWVSYCMQKGYYTICIASAPSLLWTLCTRRSSANKCPFIKYLWIFLGFGRDL